jgi:hypothetical protein
MDPLPAGAPASLRTSRSPDPRRAAIQWRPFANASARITSPTLLIHLLVARPPEDQFARKERSMSHRIRPIPGATIPILALALLLTAQSPAAGQAVVRGTVIDDATMQPIELVEVRLADTLGVARTATISDQQGRFRIEVPEPGTFDLTVTRIGYATIEGHRVRLDPEDDLQLQIRLAAQAVALEAVTVVAERRRWGRLDEFIDRAERNRRIGRGRIYLRDDLERVWPATVQSIISGYTWRGRCVPSVLVNGMPTDGLLYGISLEELEGIELYREAHLIPQEFFRHGMCGAALVWTRAPASDRPWSWRRAGVAMAIVGVIVLLFR